jgi:hypothetical protein
MGKKIHDKKIFVWSIFLVLILFLGRMPKGLGRVRWPSLFHMSVWALCVYVDRYSTLFSAVEKFHQPKGKAQKMIDTLTSLSQKKTYLKIKWNNQPWIEIGQLQKKNQIPGCTVLKFAATNRKIKHFWLTSDEWDDQPRWKRTKRKKVF